MVILTDTCLNREKFQFLEPETSKIFKWSLILSNGKGGARGVIVGINDKSKLTIENIERDVLYQLTGEICPVALSGDNFQNLTLPGEI